MGVEVQVTAWVVANNGPDLAASTFYRYRVFNRNAVPVEGFKLSFWSDVEIGNAQDDYVGSDPTRNLVIGYNADDFDETENGTPGYGQNPPAIGVRMLDHAASAALYYLNLNDGSQIGSPTTADQYRNYMDGRWLDGSAVTLGGTGYGGNQPVAPFVFPNDPGSFWSEPCAFGTVFNCTGTVPSDRRALLSSPGEDLQPGAARDYTFALVYGERDPFIFATPFQGVQDVSDDVQIIFDEGFLDAAGSMDYSLLSAPSLLAPADGSYTVTPPLLSWTDAPGAESYQVELSTSPTFETFITRLALQGSSLQAPLVGPRDAVNTVYWRVLAVSPQGIGDYSAVRSYQFLNLFYEEEPGFLFDGAGIFEAAAPGVTDVCADPGFDPACSRGLGGNGVFRDPSTDAGYFVSPRSGDDIRSLENYARIAQPEDYEMRFTEACATEACYAVYATTFAGDGTISRVPFELWQIGLNTIDDASDDIRLIPFLRRTGAEEGSDWTDRFPGSTPSLDGLGDSPATETVYMMVPDRENGYAAFAAAAQAFGGAGSIWDP